MFHACDTGSFIFIIYIIIMLYVFIHIYYMFICILYVPLLYFFIIILSILSFSDNVFIFIKCLVFTR